MIKLDCNGKYYYKIKVHDKVVKSKSIFNSHSEAKAAQELYKNDFKNIQEYPKLNNLIRQFYDYYKMRVKESSYLAFKKSTENYIIGHLPNVRIDELVYGDFLKWRDYISKFSVNVIKNNYSHLNLIFNFARNFYNYSVRCFYMLPPIKDYSIKQVAVKKKILTLQDFKKFLEAVDDYKFYVLFLLAYLTGCRIGEIRGLHVDNFNEVENYIDVIQQVSNDVSGGKYKLISPKSSNSVRRIIIPKFVSSMISEYITIYQLENNHYLFPSPKSKKDPIGSSTIKRHIKKYCLKANIEIFNFHMFRHTQATLLVDSGLDKSIVASYLGHDSEKTTEKYYLHQEQSGHDLIQELLEKKFNDLFKNFM